jgi:hypothetical protein
MIMPLRSQALNVISVWLVVAVAQVAGAESASGAPAQRRPATIRLIGSSLPRARTETCGGCSGERRVRSAPGAVARGIFAWDRGERTIDHGEGT